VLDGVHVVSTGLLKDLFEVVCRWPCLALAVTCGGHDVPHAEVTCFLIVAIVIVDCSCNPLRMLLVPLLATLSALLGVLDDDVRRCLLAAAWGRYAMQLLTGVPESVVVLTLARVPQVVFGLSTHVPPARLSMSLGIDVLTPPPLWSVG
jgi:hypothetical protein